MIIFKEEFLAHPKTRKAIRLAGSDALAMWIALKGFCSANMTDGFVPDDEIPSLPCSPKRHGRALKALLECGSVGRDGTLGSGLVDRVNNGWQLHDYLDHANSSTHEGDRREKARQRKRRSREKMSHHVTRDISVTKRDQACDIQRDNDCDKSRDLARDRAPNPTPPNPDKVPGAVGSK